ncbi:MAG: hypothetical protein V1774_02905, partial [Candidatus Eisenbacteria bacterium]
MTDATPDTHPQSAGPAAAADGLARAILVLIFAAMALRAAWVCDDAYITLRTVDNFVHGLGLTWNPPDRVQTFTHPLWLFLVTPFYALTREAFFTTIFLGLAISIAAVSLLVLRFARSLAAALAPMLALILSQAFIDYSTAGMENPLTHLWLVLFLIVYFGREDGRAARFGMLALLAALAALTRLDTLLLYVPPLAFAFVQTVRRLSASGGPADAPPRGARGLRSTRASAWLTACALLVAGFLPLVLWELFSIVYYGFPLPNTAYAKLSTGIPAGELLAQGGRYFLHTLRFDPVTLIAIAAGTALPWIRRERRGLAVALGVVLYLLYVARIGGDFMAGRFFTTPLFASVALLLVFSDTWLAAVRPGTEEDGRGAKSIGHLGNLKHDLLRLPRRALMAALAVIVLGLAPRLVPPAPEASPIRPSGIADERAYYAIEGRVLFKPRTLPKEPRIFGRERGEQLRGQGEGVVLEGAVGELGFYAGPGIKIVDLSGLADPLMARLPALRFDPSAALHRPQKSNWRIGHFLRAVPQGYLQTVMSDENRLRDRRLGEFRERLRLITRGPLWSAERWSEIRRMNSGAWRDAFDAESYRNPARLTLA